MSETSTRLLQTLVVLVGIGALTFLLLEPHLEGRNAHATLFQVYFHDLFLAYAYVASVPFFVALYQACKVLGYAGQGKASSPESVKALRIIRFSAISLIAFVAAGEISLLFGDSDDRAGGVFMGLVTTLGSIAIATAAARYERKARRSR